MLSNETANRAFEVILKQALSEDINREFDSVIVMQKINFSEEFQYRARKIHRTYQGIIKKREFKKVVPKIAITAASVILIISLAVNPNVQAFVKEVFEKIFNTHTQYEFNGNYLVSLDNFNYEIKPEYIPEGYKLSQVNFMDGYTRLQYINENSEKTKIEFAIANDTEFAVDNEHSKKQEVIIKTNIGDFYESNDIERPSYLIWTEKGYCFMITAQLSVDEFVRIAESIKFD